MWMGSIKFFFALFAFIYIICIYLHYLHYLLLNIHSM